MDNLVEEGCLLKSLAELVLAAFRVQRGLKSKSVGGVSKPHNMTVSD